MRVAAIDIGTNSVHLIIAELRPDGSFRILDSQKEMVQLGRGEFASRRLTVDAMARGLAALASFKRMCSGHEVSRILAVATSAVREASNGGDFIEEVENQTGIRVRVITGEDEGRLIYRAIRHYVEIGERRVVAVDIGGGSVELILGAGPRALVVDSLKLGHIRLAELLKGDPPSPESVDDVRNLCRRTIRRAIDPYTRGPIDLVIGTSGTIESFARMDLEAGKDSRETHLHVIEADAIRRLTKRLLKVDASERRKMAGLDAGRVATIAAGGVALQEVLEALGADRLTFCSAALREGLILDYLDRSRDRIRREDALPDVRLRSVNELLVRTQADGSHAAHVSRLALQLYDDLAPMHGLEPECRQLLHVASLLHDVGLHVEHRQHHRHSYYLIMHGSLRGFTARETELVANVARYHRKAPPRPKHAEFARLRKGDQRRVRILASLLRIADGLDRGHNQTVEAVHCQVQEGRATFYVLSWHDAEIELWGARRKSDLFEMAFEAEPEFKLEKPDESPDLDRAPESLVAAEPGLQAG
jgi:exopolyphosphatase/guanosine-5'-triphosphate,3'-diphosphate pyrophosphatase